ncbi:expressed unknown protein [Seminavis robusta]|uniref:Uncharacterized protein n=1 Tax=Seminavis robusta TaxID=568900 RepID=A0A9N8E3B7_9STRA|nr:expressed unknown protein [Seminavis robusta]|eukprot:Sro606_g174570.1 n/a (299) ;mRNA; f:54697-55729
MQAEDEKEEPKDSQLLRAMLETRALHDVDLEGSNGVKAVVEYIYIRKPQATKDAMAAKDGGVSFSQVQTLVALTGAASFFGLPMLRQKVRSVFSIVLRKKPLLSFYVLEACAAEASDVSTDLKELALIHLRSGSFSPKDDFSTLTGMSAASLEEALRDNEIDAYKRFCFLRGWAESNNIESSGRTSDANALGKHIPMEEIDPTPVIFIPFWRLKLQKIEIMAEAYKKQALAKEHGITLKKPRLELPVWKSSKSEVTCPDDKQKNHIVDVLRCDPMTSGVYEWSLEIEGCCSNDGGWSR